MSSKQDQRPVKRFWTTARLAFTFVTFGLLAALGVASCSQSHPSEVANDNANAANGNPSVTVRRNAPAAPTEPAAPVTIPASVRDMKLNSIEGKSVKLSDYTGKVVIVNMWATWCGPCQAETPDLVRFHKEYKSKGVEVLGLATKMNDPDLDEVKQFVNRQKVDYTMIYDESNFAVSLAQIAQSRGVIPQSFVISRDGRIIRHFEGFTQYPSPANPNVMTPGRLRETVDQALNEKT